MNNSQKAALLSFFCGFLSLGMEIAWVRLISFSHHSVPQAFSFVLIAYLFGIAIGASKGKKLCENKPNLKLWSWVPILLLISSIIDISGPFLYSLTPDTSLPSIVLVFLAIMASAAAKGVLFPIAHHLGSADSTSLGGSISNVYAANIAGATLGPLVVGFILFDIFSLQQTIFIISASASLLAFFYYKRQIKYTALAFSFILLSAMYSLDPHILIKQFTTAQPNKEINFISENKHGIIYTLTNTENGDIIYGGNVYDGKINTDLLKNSNGIDRLYALAAMKPNAKKVLVIGLSGGSWVEVIRQFPDVEKIDVIEIDPGYIELIKTKKEVNSLLRDKKVTIHITDGRKWLRQNKDEKFDLIVMNTTWHWRAYISNLLSQQFQTTIKTHLNSNGLMAYNATGSIDAFHTSTSVFHFVRRMSNFIYAADHDFTKNLRDGAPIILEISRKINRNNSNINEIKIAASHIAAAKLYRSNPNSALDGRPAEIITEQNMISEYKYGMGFFH